MTLRAAASPKESPLRQFRPVQPQSLSPQAIPGLPDWTNADPTTLARLDELAEEFLTGPQGLYANRERVDEYGWRNWGEIHADHEELHYRGPQPLISHYNNQFDVLLGFLLQYLRTGDERWMDLAHALARHVIDIDIYHTTEDRPAYSGGLFWFTDHYLTAATSSHRTYSRHNAPKHGDYGGGPSACHNFTTGLFLYHLLTGNGQARDAVITLADWVLAQDDGSRTVLGLVDDGPTGMASASSDALDHRPGRAAGNSINALLDAWLLTGDARYLAHAESLIQRCVHPAQDIVALNLLNAEKHWSYTVFLVSLDKYLKCKESRGQIDDAYRYGRDSLVHYGRWMLENERPYLDRPGELEFPTEAWAAQEFRKANALRLAAAYAEPASGGANAGAGPRTGGARLERPAGISHAGQCACHGRRARRGASGRRTLPASRYGDTGRSGSIVRNCGACDKRHRRLSAPPRLPSPARTGEAATALTGRSRHAARPRRQPGPLAPDHESRLAPGRIKWVYSSSQSLVPWPPPPCCRWWQLMPLPAA